MKKKYFDAALGLNMENLCPIRNLGIEPTLIKFIPLKDKNGKLTGGCLRVKVGSKLDKQIGNIVAEYPNTYILDPFVEKDNETTVLDAIKEIPQQGQVQYDLQHQLRELRIAANKLGLYDAADFLRPHCG